MAAIKNNSEQVPTYAGNFHCIGPDCEDTCCESWDIPVDQKTHECYRQLSSSSMSKKVNDLIQIVEPKQPPPLYSVIRRQHGPCAFFGEDRLCELQKAFGPKLQPSACSIYPRSLSWVDGMLEGSLSLSCPEAARNVLLDSGFLSREADLFSKSFRVDNTYGVAIKSSGADRAEACVREVRAFLLSTIRKRSAPLWERLLSVGLLCRTLDETISPDRRVNVPRFRQVFIAESFKDQSPILRTLPANPQLAFSIMLEITNERLEDLPSNRYSETAAFFLRGVGGEGKADPENMLERLLYANERFYKPFLASRPHILEHYLENYIIQNIFPFGRSGSIEFIKQSMIDSFFTMCTQFSWINFILMGVSGFHRSDFSEDHLVKAVQSCVREVEHYPLVQRSINKTVQKYGQNNLEGMSILLRF